MQSVIFDLVLYSIIMQSAIMYVMKSVLIVQCCVCANRNRVVDVGLVRVCRVQGAGSMPTGELCSQHLSV